MALDLDVGATQCHAMQWELYISVCVCVLISKRLCRDTINFWTRMSLGVLSQDELLKTVFVSGLSKKVSNSILEKSFSLIPGFSSLIRPAQFDGTPSAFAFLKFSTIAGVSQTIRVLPQCEIDGKSLEARCEQATLDWLAKTPGSDPTIQQDPSVIAGITQNLRDSGNSGVEQERNDASFDEEKDVMEIIRRSLGEDKSLNDIEISDLDLPRVKEEIKKFREESLAMERKREQDALDYEKKTQDKLMSLNEFTKTSATSAEDENFIDVNITYDDDDYNEIPPGPEGDAEVEQLKLHKIKENLDKKFIDRERKWLHRESYRAEAQKRESQKKSSRSGANGLTEEEKAARVDKYASFDEDDPGMQRHVEYFYNHGEWSKARREFRRREQEIDERDMREEEEEQKTTGFKEASTTSSTEDTKISLKLFGAKPVSQTAWKDEDESQVASVLKPLPADTGEKKSVEIPNGLESLVAYEVKWDHLNQSILEDVLRPFIVDNVVEYLGVEEEDLINFIVNHVKDHKPLTELVAELEVTLDEDAPILGEALWKLLIAETEKSS